MKKLYIVRHAKKANDVIDQDDYDKELTEIGVDNAKEMATKFAIKNLSIDLIIASPAKRAKITAEIFAEALNYNKSIMFNEVLYMAFVNELLETISYIFDTVDSVLLVGHNPSLTALALTLVGFKEKFQSAAVMEIDFDCDSWLDISKDNAKLVYYEVPSK